MKGPECQGPERSYIEYPSRCVSQRQARYHGKQARISRGFSSDNRVTDPLQGNDTGKASTGISQNYLSKNLQQQHATYRHTRLSNQPTTILQSVSHREKKKVPNNTPLTERLATTTLQQHSHITLSAHTWEMARSPGGRETERASIFFSSNRSYARV